MILAASLKRCGRKWLCPTSEVISWYLPGSNKENTKDLTQSQNLNCGYPYCKAET
jgi:hypothetical protein